MTDRYVRAVHCAELRAEFGAEPSAWELRSASGLHGRIFTRAAQLECADGRWTVATKRFGPIRFETEQPGFPIVAYRPSGLRSGGRIALGEAATFQLRLKPFSTAWGITDDQKRPVYRISQRTVKGGRVKFRVLDLEPLNEETFLADWLSLVLTSCYVILALQPSLHSVGGGGGG